MAANRTTVSILVVWLTIGAAGIVCQAQTAAQADAALPNGVKAVWGLDKAWREKTPTRERVCLNGLWRWLVRNIIEYVSTWKPPASRKALYVGDAAGKDHLEKSGVSVGAYEGGTLSAEQVLIVGPGGGKKLAANSAAIDKWLKAGGHMLAVGLDETGAASLPGKVTMKNAEHIAAYFDPPAKDSPLAGVGPADAHNRDPRQLPLVTGGAQITGDGVLATAEGGNVVFCQLAPWTFDYSKQYNVKRTFRRASFTLTRLLANMGVASSTPLLARFKTPPDASKQESRWQDGLYLDQPGESDDPYRFFRW